MLNPLRTFFDHSRHTLVVRGIEATLDVLAFDGEEQLSQPFKYRVEFTSSDHDIAASDMLRRQADFSLHAAPHDLPPVMPWCSGKNINAEFFRIWLESPASSSGWQFVSAVIKR